MQTDTSITMLNTSLIIPNKYQPRKIFEEKALNTLAESIKTYGIINPILVRKKDDKYEIIAGERRFRAAKQIGLNEVPVIIKSTDEQQTAELALIENLERQGLSPIEEAKSYEEIMKIGNQTQASLATKLGKSQSSIANKIRLLSLPQEIQDALANKKISERHARSLLSVETKDKQLELLDKIIKEKLTVKETEEIINTKEIDEDEIKKAINDIMKSLNITDEEEKEEKEDDNMNNGNFFPNFDNNNIANNNASLNMMNMQSMNQPQMEQPMLAPTMNQPMSEPIQMNVAPQTMNEPTIPSVPSFDQFGPQPPSQALPDMYFNNQFAPQMNMEPTPVPEPIVSEPVSMMQEPMINAPLFGQQPLTMDNNPTPSFDSAPQMTVPMMDEPLFNPNITMQEPVSMMQEPIMNSIDSMVAPTSFEVPLTVPQPIENIAPQPEISTQPMISELEKLQEFLNNNGYNYKTYGNDTNDCIIIEIPRN